MYPWLHANDCDGSDCIHHEIGSQASCEQVERDATYDCRWPAGLDTNADYIIEGGDIVAYQIRWLSGKWSGWFVTGVNDIDVKFNPSGRTCAIPCKANHMRRFWSYFYDHQHRFIICNPRSDYEEPPCYDLSDCPSCPSCSPS